MCGMLMSETEVTNGFVKDGSSLPYIFETNESGNRKRTSKILPVCGMCGKKFVCVTTMKRHLVTHTGEKPFSCKVCGKMYTQKGNLRVHERTHRNDRPFECNICHQKFYRKEPMQKHQWRQHGIVHFKSRPANTTTNNNINNNNPQPSLSIIGAEGVLYNALNERIKGGDNGGLSHPEVKFEDIPVSYVIESLPVETLEVVEAEVLQPPVYVPLPAAEIYQEERIEVPEAVEETIVHTTEAVEVEEANKPIKLKMKLAQAYMKEIEENREREERFEQEREGRDWTDLSSSSLYRIDYNLSDIRLSSSESTSTGNTDSNPSSRPQSRLPDQQTELRIVELHAETRETQVEGPEKENLEFLCKSCGTKCLVSDPYSFKCPTCNMKYTSLPTHMIADPLQCIGCTETFPHKPALKHHQSSVDKERPFKCCKCGFEFRQKAHLQKHQWRIHRKKFESDPSVREAEALLFAVEDISGRKPGEELRSDSAPETVSAEVPQRIGKDCSPLDLSPTKMYGTAGSINKWVEQVETARTPIIPDVSIHKKPVQPEPMSRFKELLSRPVQINPAQKDQVQLHIINSLSGRREESLTIRLVEGGSKFNHDPKPCAVKSKPQVEVSVPSWKNIEQAENPLLNQIPVREPQNLPSSSVPSSLYICRASKRPRTEQNVSQNHRTLSQTRDEAVALSELNQPADLSIRSKDGSLYSSILMREETISISTPLKLNTSPMRLDTPYSTLSPPLNLSNTSPQVSPYDYRISKSNLISGHFQRLKSQDERSGI